VGPVEPPHGRLEATVWEWKIKRHGGWAPIKEGTSAIGDLSFIRREAMNAVKVCPLANEGKGRRRGRRDWKERANLPNQADDIHPKRAGGAALSCGFTVKTGGPKSPRTQLWHDRGRKHLSLPYRGKVRGLKGMSYRGKL